MSDNQKWSILQGDALKVLGTFAPNTFDAVITDPPYASGGRTQTEKNKIHSQKVFQHGRERTAPFRWGRQGPALLDPLGGGVVV